MASVVGALVKHLSVENDGRREARCEASGRRGYLTPSSRKEARLSAGPWLRRCTAPVNAPLQTQVDVAPGSPRASTRGARSACRRQRRESAQGDEAVGDVADGVVSLFDGHREGGLDASRSAEEELAPLRLRFGQDEGGKRTEPEGALD